MRDGEADGAFPASLARRTRCMPGGVAAPLFRRRVTRYRLSHALETALRVRSVRNRLEAAVHAGACSFRAPAKKNDALHCYFPMRL